MHVLFTVCLVVLLVLLARETLILAWLLLQLTFLVVVCCGLALSTVIMAIIVRAHRLRLRPQIEILPPEPHVWADEPMTDEPLGSGRRQGTEATPGRR